MNSGRRAPVTKATPNGSTLNRLDREQLLPAPCSLPGAMLTAAFVGDPPERGGGVDLDGDGIPDDLEFAFEDDPTYYRRGDPSWDTDEEKLTKRRKLRRSFKIQGALIKFWSLFGVSPENTVPFESYAEVHRKITSVLAPEMSDRESAEAAKEDWNDDVPTRRMAADADGTLQTRRLPPHYKQHRWEPRYVEPAWVPSHVRRAAHPHAPPNPSPVPAQRPASPPIPRREMEKKVWSPMWKGSSVKEAWQGWIGSAAGNMAHRSAPISPRKLSDLLDPKPPPRQALRDELRRCLLQGRSEEEVRVEKDLTVAVLRRAL